MERNEGLNGLPDHLLMVILSQLPLKTAIATAVLSRRWRWLWTHLTDINLDLTLYPCHPHLYRAGKLPTLIQNVLSKLTPPFIRSLSFHLNYEYGDYLNEHNTVRNFDNIVTWFNWASRHKTHLRKLRVVIGPDGPDRFRGVPLWIFQTSSLEILELNPWWFRLEDYDHDKYRNLSFHLPNLKKVCVDLFCYTPWILEKLVSSSPSLEVLSCHLYLANPSRDDDPFIVNLSSRKLKRLEMNLYEPIHVVINAPELEYLIFHAKKYWYKYNKMKSYQISFVDFPTALLTCSISPWTDDQGRDIFLPSNLSTVISGVRSLTTADQNPTPFIASINFRCLTHLRFRVCVYLSTLDGLALLQQCPVLEVLCFDLSEYLQPTSRDQNWSLPDSAPQCLVTHVKRIEILAHPFVARLEAILLQLVNYLLGNAEALELLRITITYHGRNLAECSSAGYDEIHLIKELFKVPRSSPQSQVEFCSPDRSVLSQEGNNQGTLLI